MKTRIIFLLAVLLASLSFAQQGINYKAAIKDSSGNVVASQSIDVRFTIIADDGPTNVYLETHTGATTDANGIVILNIGDGTTSDIFADIAWGSDIHSLKVEIDIEQDATFEDMGTTQFMAVPYALNSKKVDTCGLSIGDTHAGGIIFYLDSTGCHGLVCAPTDQSVGIVAYPSGGLTGTFGSGIEVGKFNSKAIVFNFLEQGGYAAELCDDLILGGYDDWYLPSRFEAMLMSYNVGGDAESPNTNIGGFSTDSYWTSTEFHYEISSPNIEVFNAVLGDYWSSWNSPYNMEYAVRAIRSF